ncbi:MAG: cupin domain-containing protein [Pseudomonadota bacterium]
MAVDWLSHLMRLLALEGRVEVRCMYGAAWEGAYEPSAPGDIPYHIILSGSARITTSEGGPPLQLVAGDMVLLTHGSAHVMNDGSGEAPVPASRREQAGMPVLENGGGDGRLDMLCGRFMLAPPQQRLMRTYLPARLLVRSGDHHATAPSASAVQLAGLVALMRTEYGMDTMGGRAMLDALSAALFVLALRLASEDAAAPAGLLAVAGHPRLAPALAAMVTEPGRPWTLPALAKLCNMSRATMARHFEDKLGHSASDLLIDIRMALATNELKKGHVSTEKVAEMVGYQSVAAFQRIFKQRMGVTPAAWRKT